MMSFGSYQISIKQLRALIQSENSNSSLKSNSRAAQPGTARRDLGDSHRLGKSPSKSWVVHRVWKPAKFVAFGCSGLNTLRQGVSIQMGGWLVSNC